MKQPQYKISLKCITKTSINKALTTFEKIKVTGHSNTFNSDIRKWRLDDRCDFKTSHFQITLSTSWCPGQPWCMKRLYLNKQTSKQMVSGCSHSILIAIFFTLSAVMNARKSFLYLSGLVNTNGNCRHLRTLMIKGTR